MSEKVYLVVADLKKTKKHLIQEKADEMVQLIESSGGEVVGSTISILEKPDSKTFIRKGKLLELTKEICRLKPDVIIFSIDLTPRQLTNLEKTLEKRVVDRTRVILDIFARHAKTKEGKLQIELAQLNYLLPRLSEIWEELDKVGGGGIGMRGPGEHKIEMDRRGIRKKISKIKKELEKVRAHRQRVRQQRKRNNKFVVSLVGYTNAGKSTLLNQLAGSDVYVEDQLFATLDPTTRRVNLQSGVEILITDTVGFMQDLPHTLIEAFKATLEEITESDLLIKVTDISDPGLDSKIAAVDQVLEEINANDILKIEVFNKLDCLGKRSAAEQIQRKYSNAILLSAKTGTGTKNLLKAIEANLEKVEMAV